MRAHVPIFTMLLLAGLAGCGSWSNPIKRISPYKLDIQQGNYLTQEKLDKLKPGMTPSQVRFLLGTPLVVDPFRANRWDYVYSLMKEGQLLEQRRVTVVFENDRLKSLEGDVTPAPSRQEEKK